MTTRSATPPDTASRVWTALHEFVTGQDRRRALHAALDLGPAKVELLIKLADGPMTRREIARAGDVDPPAATVGVDKLEARGLVQRTAHPDDNRRKLVHLTDAGREAARRGQAILNEPPPALTNLDSDDLARLDEILTRLQTNSRPLCDQHPRPAPPPPGAPADDPHAGTEIRALLPAPARRRGHPLIDAGLRGYRDTLEPALSGLDRKSTRLN